MASPLSGHPRIISDSLELCLLVTVAFVSALCWLVIPLLYVGVGTHIGMAGQTVDSPSVLYWTHLRTFPPLTEFMRQVARRDMFRYWVAALIVTGSIVARCSATPNVRAVIYILALWFSLAVILMFITGILIIL